MLSDHSSFIHCTTAYPNLAMPFPVQENPGISLKSGKSLTSFGSAQKHIMATLVTLVLYLSR